ncbi:hypothetical protein Pelo_15048 [Pelomyxa schiedti]|nr:hypothetical protein Pelo_15048 [Pelomyxa schiedti]
MGRQGPRTARRRVPLLTSSTVSLLSVAKGRVDNTRKATPAGRRAIRVQGVHDKRAKVTGAPSPSGHSRGAPKAPKFVKSFLSAIGSSKPTVSTTNTFVLGKDLLGCIFKRVILIWEQHYSQAYYDCVNSTPYEVQIARMDKGLPEIELRPEHYLPIQSRTPNSAEEVLEATRTLLSLSTVCKSWREAALDDPVWLDVVKESLVRAYIPGSSPAATTTTTGSTKTGEPVIPLAHVTTCRELAMRVSRHTVARGVLPVRKWAPNYSLVLQHLPCGNDVFDFIKGCKTGTIISEGQCVIGGGNPSLDYWRRNAKLIAQL